MCRRTPLSWKESFEQGTVPVLRAQEGSGGGGYNALPEESLCRIRPGQPGSSENLTPTKRGSALRRRSRQDSSQRVIKFQVRAICPSLQDGPGGALYDNLPGCHHKSSFKSIAVSWRPTPVSAAIFQTATGLDLLHSRDRPRYRSHSRMFRRSRGYICRSRRTICEFLAPAEECHVWRRPGSRERIRYRRCTDHRLRYLPARRSTWVDR